MGRRSGPGHSNLFTSDTMTHDQLRVEAETALGQRRYLNPCRGIVRLPVRNWGNEDRFAVSVVRLYCQHDDRGTVLGAFVSTLRRVALPEISVADNESRLRIRNPRHARPSTRDRIGRLRPVARRG